MSGLLQEVVDTLDGKKRLQAIFGEKEGTELAELAIKLGESRCSSAEEFAWLILMDAARGLSFGQIREHWSAKLERKAER